MNRAPALPRSAHSVPWCRLVGICKERPRQTAPPAAGCKTRPPAEPLSRLEARAQSCAAHTPARARLARRHRMQVFQMPCANRAKAAEQHLHTQGRLSRFFMPVRCARSGQWSVYPFRRNSARAPALQHGKKLLQLVGIGILDNVVRIARVVLYAGVRCPPAPCTCGRRHIPPKIAGCPPRTGAAPRQTPQNCARLWGLTTSTASTPLVPFSWRSTVK